MIILNETRPFRVRRLNCADFKKINQTMNVKSGLTNVKVLLIRVQILFEIVTSQDFVHTRLKSCNYISRIQWLIGRHGIDEK